MTAPHDPPPPESHFPAIGEGLSGDEAVERLIELARDASSEGPAVQGFGLYGLERRFAQHHGKRTGQRARLLWWVIPAAAAAASGGVFFLRQRAITFEVLSGKVSDGGYVSSGGADASVRFSDESDLGLEPGTRLRISDLAVHGARVMLEGGLLHVRIHPQPRNNWTLDAGPYVVHVTGTEFDLAWRVDEQTLDLRLQRGSVTVEGPLADGGVKVGRGQHLIANANAGTLSLIDENNPSPSDVPHDAPAPPAPTATSTATASVAVVHPALLRKGPGPTTGARTEEQSWGARVARGDFDGVVEDAERRGLDKALTEASAVELAALADAARYARRPEVARRALIAQRAHYPDSVQARDAPFFLGSLAQAEKNDASELEWYGVYSRESPNGAYASEALGRTMVLIQRVHGTEAARPIASAYLARFSDGAYASAARRLLQTQ